MKGSQSLEISDLRESRQIHLEQDKKYPLAIFAYPIRTAKTIYGFLWYGIDKPYQFSDNEKKYIKNIIEFGKNLFITILKNHTFKEISIRQNLILETVPMPVLLIDKDNVVLYSNQNANKSFYPQGELSGKSIQELFGVTKPDVLNNNNSAKGGKHYEFINGSKYLIHSENIETADSHKLKVLVFEDITSQEQWKNNLSESSTLISHDLRVPLATLKGYLTMLPIMGEMNQQQRGYIEKGISQIDEINEQIKGLFANERLEKGRWFDKARNGYQ